MSRPSNQQRNKNYYNPNAAKNSKNIEWNAYGIFFSCEFEKNAVREAKNLLIKYLDEPTSSESDKADEKPEKELDIADELRKACQESTQPVNAQRVRQLPTGIKHCLFFSVADVPREKITKFVDKFVDDCQATQQCRYLLRALPIEDVSPSEIPDIKYRLRRILEPHFHEYAAKPENEGKHATFAVDYKKRFSDQIDRQKALDIVCEIVGEIDAESKVNLNQPDFTILFHVVRKAVMISCIADYNQRRKFALKAQDDTEGSPTKKIEQDNEDNDNGSD